MRPRSPAAASVSTQPGGKSPACSAVCAGAGAAARRLHAPENKTVAAAIVTMTTRGRPAIRINAPHTLLVVHCPMPHSIGQKAPAMEVNVPGPPQRVDRVTLARLHLCRGRRVGRLGHDIACGGGCHLSDTGAVRPARIVAGRQIRPAEASGRVTTDVASTDWRTTCAHAGGCRLAHGVAGRIARRDAAAAVGDRVLVRRRGRPCNRRRSPPGDWSRRKPCRRHRRCRSCRRNRSLRPRRWCRPGRSCPPDRCAGLAGRARLTACAGLTGGARLTACAGLTTSRGTAGARDASVLVCARVLGLAKDRARHRVVARSIRDRQRDRHRAARDAMKRRVRGRRVVDRRARRHRPGVLERVVLFVRRGHRQARSSGRPACGRASAEK